MENHDFSDTDSRQKVKILLSRCLAEFEEAYFATDAENPCRPLNAEEKEKALKLIEDALLNYRDNYQLIGQKLVKRTFARLDKTVSSILLLGATELAQENQPFKVIINEYILMAKKYGQGDSFSLVNGVLDAIAKK